MAAFRYLWCYTWHKRLTCLRTLIHLKHANLVYAVYLGANDAANVILQEVSGTEYSGPRHGVS